MADANNTYTPEPVKDKRPTPPGILPKNVQAWVLAGIAFVMIVVIAFSGGTNPPKKPSPGVPAGPVLDPNAARIQEYQKRIEEETRKLQIEQAQLALTHQTLGSTSDDSGLMNRTPTRPFGEAAFGSGFPERNPQNEAIRLDKAKREYESLFASNVALSYRKEFAAQQPAPDSVANVGFAPNAAIAANGSDLTKMLALYGYPSPIPPPASPAAPLTAALAPAPPPPAVQQPNPGMIGKPTPDEKLYRLFEGSILETVLTNRLDGSFSGPVNCMVTTNVYSRDRMHVLVPQGTRVLGEARKVETFGQQRLVVVFHRFIMPDGYSMSLDQFQGVNQIGETGLKDQINHHYLQTFGVSLAIGAIAGLGHANTRSRVDPSGLDAYQEGIAESLSQTSLNILDRYLNVLPTHTIREGHRVKIYLAGDLDLPAYEKHKVPVF